MAERDELARPLGAHHARQLGDTEDVALRAAAVDDEAHRLGRDGHGGLRDGAPGRDRLVGDVDHPRPPGPIDVREPAAFGAWLRSLVHRLLRGPAIRPDAALGYVGAQCDDRQARSSHHRSTARRPAAQSSASGTTARASAAARAEMTWLSCPPGEVDDRPGRGRRGPAPRRRRAPPRRAGTRAGRGSCGRARRGRRGRPAGAGRRRPARLRIAGRTNSSNVTAEDTGLPGSPNSRTGRSATRPIRDAEGERLAGLDGDPPQVDPADRARSRS